MAKNLLTQLGVSGFTDEDYQEEFGVSPNDPDFNKRMFEIVENQNFEAYIRDGLSVEKARAMAADRKRKAISALPKTVVM